jgi:hypothetical protein
MGEIQGQPILKTVEHILPLSAEWLEKNGWVVV